MTIAELETHLREAHNLEFRWDQYGPSQDSIQATHNILHWRMNEPDHSHAEK